MVGLLRRRYFEVCEELGYDWYMLEAKRSKLGEACGLTICVDSVWSEQVTRWFFICW